MWPNSSNPGAPYARHYWDGTKFVLAPMPQTLSIPTAARNPTHTQIEPRDAASWAPDARAWTNSNPSVGGSAADTGPPMAQSLGTAENPATTQTTGQMARDTAGAIGGLFNGGIGWGGALGTLAGLATGAPLGTMGALFDRVQNISEDARNQTNERGYFGSGIPSQYEGGAAAQSAYSNLHDVPPGGLMSMTDTLNQAQGDIANMTPDQMAGVVADMNAAIAGNPDLFAKGGKVRPPRGPMPNPPGPDDQLIGAQTGEGVITRQAMKRYPGLLEAANAGRLDPKRIRGLIG